MMEEKHSCLLHDEERNLCVRKVPIFNHLNSTEMMEILKRTRQMTFEKDEMIYRKGEPLNYLYIVHRGKVKVFQIFESGKEQLLHILGTGDFMGELALFRNKMIDNYAIAMDHTEICAIHRDDFQDILQKHPTISLKILGEFSERLEKMEDLVGQLSVQDVESRIAHYLMNLFEKEQKIELTLPMSKGDLASFLGTTQETLSRRLSNFQMNGWIHQKGHRKITLLNVEALGEVARGKES